MTTDPALDLALDAVALTVAIVDTESVSGNERALADDVGEALLAAGLLAEKPSVGQRHVFLNPRRAGDIHALIERGEAPGDLRLP